MNTLNLKGIACLYLFCLVFFQSQSQNTNVSIGTESLKDRAVLWLKGNGNQGLLLPVVTNRSAFTGLNNSDDKGMLVFDSSDNKIYYWNGSAWIEAGGSTGGSNQTLTLNGNTFTLSGNPASSFNLSSNAPVTGQALVWNGSAWAASSTSGDVSGTTTATVVNGLKGRALPATLPATANALVYNGSAWTFQPLSSAGEANTASNVGTAGVGVFKQKTGQDLEFQKINAASNRITVTQDAANSEVDIDVNQINLSIASTQVTGLGALATLSAITSAQITDGTITNTDISPTAAIQVSKLAPGTNGQVLSVAAGVPVWSTPSGSGTVTSVGTGTGLTGGPITGTGTISIAPAGVSSTELADNAVTSAKIVNATITGIDIAPTTISADKLAASGASAGQVLKWSGSAWVPQNDDTGAGAVPTLNTGQILIGDGATNSAATLSGDATLTGGAITIANNAVTTVKINAGAVDNAKLADNAVTTLKLANNAVTTTKIADATITGADIAPTTITADKLAQSAANANDVLRWNGTNWVPVALPASGTVTSVSAGTGLTGGPITTTGTLSVAPLGITATELAGNAVTSAKILDGTIVNADVSAAAAIAGTKISPDFGAQNVTTTASGNFSSVNVNLASGGNEAITIALSTAGAIANQGIRVNVGGSTNTNYGVYPYVGGGNISYGVHAFSESSATTGYALYGRAFGTTPTAYGVFGQADGPGTNYGVYGIATTGTTNWAGYFAGNTAITGALSVGGGSSFGTAGQVLTSQGSGTAPTWSSIPGSYTTNNQVPRGDGSGLVSSNIFSDGTNVGIGAASPRSVFEIQGGNLILSGSSGAPNDPVDIDFKTFGDVFKAKIWTDPNSNTLWFSTSTTPASNKHITINPQGLVGIGRTPVSNALEVEGDASKTAGASWLTNSDRRIKTDIEDIDNSLEIIRKLRPVKFRYTDQWMRKHPSIKDQYYFSFIAQEYAAIFPESVRESAQFIDGDPNAVLQIDVHNAQITTIRAVQELLKKIESLELENEVLKSKNRKLEDRVSAYEQQQAQISQDLAEIKALLGYPTSTKNQTQK